MAATAYLFVYGSLRKTRDGRLHPLLQDQAEFIGYTSIPGRLYDIQNYPGAISCPSLPDKQVHGEIYSLFQPEKLLETLDEYEECSSHFPSPHEYRRTKISIELPVAHWVDAWVYLYNRPIDGLAEIIGGDYQDYLRHLAVKA